MDEPRIWCSDVSRGGVEGDARRHLGVLRVGIGGTFRAVCGDGYEYHAVLEAAGCRVLERRPLPPLPELVLHCALLKRDAMDLVVEKASELGVTRLVPLITRRTVVPSERVRADRWERIARESAAQCGRGDVMAIHPPVPWSEAVRQPGVVFWERASAAVSRPANVFIGPEGGLEASEVEEAASHGSSICSLGPRILRAETAAIAAVAVVQYLRSLHERRS